MTASPRQRILIGDFQIDASITESHEFDSDVTDFPVETGSSITDNVRPKPIVVTIDGIVSDTPLGTISGVRTGTDALPSADALAALLAIRDARQPISITTSLKSFPSMVLTTLAVPRDATTGAALRFSATFTEVLLVTNNRTTVRVATPSSDQQVNLGSRVGLGVSNLHTGGRSIFKTGTEGPDHMPVYVYNSGPRTGQRVSDADLTKATQDAGAVRINPRTGQPLNPSDYQPTGTGVASVQNSSRAPWWGQ